MYENNLRKNYKNIFETNKKLTEVFDIYKILNKQTKEEFFTKYYKTNFDLEILLAVLETKIIDCEKKEIKDIKKYFLLHYFSFLIIKEGLLRNQIDNKVLKLIDIDLLIKKTITLANILIYEKEDEEVLNMKQNDIYLKLNSNNYLITRTIENKKIILEIVEKEER